MQYLKITLQLRYYNREADADQEQDFILSPVKDKHETFFDSRKITDNNLPKDSDANGAYHIALKGLFILHKLNSGDQEKISSIKNKDWFRFITNKEDKPYKKAG